MIFTITFGSVGQELYIFHIYVTFEWNGWKTRRLHIRVALMSSEYAHERNKSVYSMLFLLRQRVDSIFPHKNRSRMERGARCPSIRMWVNNQSSRAARGFSHDVYQASPVEVGSWYLRFGSDSFI